MVTAKLSVHQEQDQTYHNRRGEEEANHLRPRHTPSRLVPRGLACLTRLTELFRTLSDFGNFVFHPPLALIRLNVLLEPVRIVPRHRTASSPTRHPLYAPISRQPHRTTGARRSDSRSAYSSRATGTPSSRATGKPSSRPS